MPASIGRTCARAILALALLLPGGAALAGIDNSHHDMRYHLPEADACLVCHGRKDANSYEELQDSLGAVGGQCLLLCHSGKGILPETDTLVPQAGPSVSTDNYSTRKSPDYTAVYFTRSHGRRPENLKNGEGVPVPWPPKGLVWDKVAAGTPLECTSCHAIHDNAHPPFLKAPLAASYPNLDGFCDRCHVERATGNLTAPPDGSHPVDFPLDNQAAAARDAMKRRPRRILLQRYGKADGTGTVNVFDVPAPASRDLAQGGASWAMGGHLASKPGEAMNPWAGPGSPQQVGCYTCHSAHRPNDSGEKNLVVLSAADAGRGWSPLCVGCHGAATSLSADRREWNAGMADFGHPAGSDTAHDGAGVYISSVSGFRFRVAKPSPVDPPGPNRFGDRGELLCTTCHKVHFGAPGSMAIVNMGQGSKSVCKSCHDGTGSPFSPDGSAPPNSHHVTATKERWDDLALKGVGYENPVWADPGSGLGDLSGGMDCADCHIFNGTSHNW